MKKLFSILLIIAAMVVARQPRRSRQTKIPRIGFLAGGSAFCLMRRPR